MYNMVNYELGKVYRIKDNTNNNVYIGSTCEYNLKDRLAQHEAQYRFFLSTGKSKYTSFNILANKDYVIELVEACPCNNKDELKAYEQHHIQNTPNVVNKIKKLKLTKEDVTAYGKEYYNANRETISQKSKAKYALNKDEIKSKIKAYAEANKEAIKLQKKAYYQRKKAEKLAKK